MSMEGRITRPLMLPPMGLVAGEGLYVFYGPLGLIEHNTLCKVTNTDVKEVYGSSEYRLQIGA